MIFAQALKRRYPRAYGIARAAAEPLLRELRFLSKVGLRLIVDQVIRKPEWRASLPLQRTSRTVLDGVPGTDFDALRRQIVGRGVQSREGTHTLYLAPEALESTVLAGFMQRYPPGCGLKIVKNPVRSGEGQYLREAGQSVIQKAMLYSPRELVLVANFLHLHGLGPRMYDFVELRTHRLSWHAYVVAHCDDTAPSLEDCLEGVRRMRELERDGALTVAVPGKFEHPDFSCPGCGGNALMDRATGAFRYVDFQNFVLVNYQAFINALAAPVAKDTHFGDESLFRGGRYLYQSVPGSNLPAKRSTQQRASVIDRLLASAEISVEDRLVLDYGCNQGMMMGLYLNLGARWCHGWDLPKVVQHTERLLLATGCTRFSVAGAVMDEHFCGFRELPDFLTQALDGCVISYLAMRRHVGWLRELELIPWSAMIVEGHEGETEGQFQEHLGSLRQRVAFRVGALERLRDGDSGTRVAAVLLRSQS